MPSAIRKALTTMQLVLMRTKTAMLAGKNPNGELMLIESRSDIVTPHATHEIEIDRIVT